MMKNENFHLQQENRDLRDHIEILENVVGAQTYDLNTEAWKDLLTPSKSDAASSTASTHNTSNAPPVLLGMNHSNSAIVQMTNELIEFRKQGSETQNKLKMIEMQH